MAGYKKRIIPGCAQLETDCKGILSQLIRAAGQQEQMVAKNVLALVNTARESPVDELSFQQWQKEFVKNFNAVRVAIAEGNAWQAPVWQNLLKVVNAIINLVADSLGLPRPTPIEDIPQPPPPPAPATPASPPVTLGAATAPGVELGAAVSDKRWLNSFEGMVVFEGTARRDENKLLGAKGKIGFKAIANSLTPEVFMHHCFERITGEGDDFESALEASNEESEESQTPAEFIADYADMMPDLSKKAEIRVFSLFHGGLAHGFDSGWESEFDYVDWPYEQKIPPGVLLVEGVGNCEGVLDFQQITQRVLETYFRKQGDVPIPYTVDLQFCFYADHSKSQGEGARFLLTKEDEGNGEIAVAEISCAIDRYLSDDQRRMRIVAGPCENALRLVKHPDSPLQIEPDPEPPPTGCISAIVTVPASAGELPEHLQKLFVVGAQGEIGQVMCWTSANQVESLPT